MRERTHQNRCWNPTCGTGYVLYMNMSDNYVQPLRQVIISLVCSPHHKTLSNPVACVSHQSTLAPHIVIRGERTLPRFGGFRAKEPFELVERGLGNTQILHQTLQRNPKADAILTHMCRLALCIMRAMRRANEWGVGGGRNHHAN